jgi:hypothetical protein
MLDPVKMAKFVSLMDLRFCAQGHMRKFLFMRRLRAILCALQAADFSRILTDF